MPGEAAHTLPPSPPTGGAVEGVARGTRDEMGWMDRGIDAARFAVMTVMSSRLRRARVVVNNAWRAWRVLGVIASVSDLHIRSGSVMSLNRRPRPASRTPRCLPCPASPSPSPISLAPHPLPLPLSLPFILVLLFPCLYPSSSPPFHKTFVYCPLFHVWPFHSHGSLFSSSIFVLFSMLSCYTSSVTGLFLHYSPGFHVTQSRAFLSTSSCDQNLPIPLTSPRHLPPPFKRLSLFDCDTTTTCLAPPPFTSLPPPEHLVPALVLCSHGRQTFSKGYLTFVCVCLCSGQVVPGLDPTWEGRERVEGSRGERDDARPCLPPQGNGNENNNGGWRWIWECSPLSVRVCFPPFCVLVPCVCLLSHVMWHIFLSSASSILSLSVCCCHLSALQKRMNKSVSTHQSKWRASL